MDTTFQPSSIPSQMMTVTGQGYGLIAEQVVVEETLMSSLVHLLVFVKRVDVRE